MVQSASVEEGISKQQQPVSSLIPHGVIQICVQQDCRNTRCDFIWYCRVGSAPNILTKDVPGLNMPLWCRSSASYFAVVSVTSQFTLLRCLTEVKLGLGSKYNLVRFRGEIWTFLKRGWSVSLTILSDIYKDVVETPERQQIVHVVCLWVWPQFIFVILGKDAHAANTFVETFHTCLWVFLWLKSLLLLQELAETKHSPGGHTTSSVC